MMKQILIIALLVLVLRTVGHCQPGFSSAVPHTNTTINWSPSASGSRIAVDYSARKIYIHNGTTWLEYEQGIDRITGSVAPAYTPAAGQSLWAVNAANELYYYNSTWVCISCKPTIASTQIAYGSDANNITGNANFVYDAGAAGMSIKGGTPSLTLNATTSTSAFGHLFSYNNAPRFRFIYQENINEFHLQGTDAAGDFTVNPAILAKRGASGNKVGFNLAAGSTPAGQIHVNGSGATSGTYTAQFHNSTGTNNALVVRDDGNVGIGTNAPSAKLHVIGNYEQKTSSGTIGTYRINEPGGDQVRGTWDYYVNSNLVPDFFGKFGFKFEGGTNNAAKQFQIHVSDASAPKMVINGLGNVGVGNASPTRTLDINGELRIRDLATTTATKILVVDNDGVVSSATLGSGLSLSSGVLANNVYFDALETATSGTSYQITGLKSKVLVTGSLIATVNLPDIVTTVPTSNQVNPGFTVIIEISRLDSTTLSVASGSSDILFSSGSSYTGSSSLNLTGNITNVLLCVAMQDGRWTILK